MTARADAPPGPLAVRVLRVAGWITLVLALTAFGIGAAEGFDDGAQLWAVIGGELLATTGVARLGTRPSQVGFVAAVVACSMLVVLPPIPILIALIGSQTWPGLRRYYGLPGRTA